jgi:peptide-methionine (S)-S-oxide reductase
MTSLTDMPSGSFRWMAALIATMAAMLLLGLGACSPRPAATQNGSTANDVSGEARAGKERSVKSTNGSTPGANSSNTAASPTATRETAVFGLGCFWSPELKFAKLPGVIDAEVGYAGGITDNPTYEDVCTGATGHAEVVRITYDPSVVTYQQLLDTFFAVHDPTQKNRQGPDVGTQYRSVIFPTNDAQKALATATIAKLTAAGTFRRPIATTIEPPATFWRAEEYHQDYLKKRGMDTCPSGG